MLSVVVFKMMYVPDLRYLVPIFNLFQKKATYAQVSNFHGNDRFGSL